MKDVTNKSFDENFSPKIIAAVFKYNLNTAGNILTWINEYHKIIIEKYKNVKIINVENTAN